MYKLREIERKDLVEINRWRNDPKLIDCLGAPFRYINIDVDNKWFDGYMANRNQAIRCAVTDLEDHILGLVSLVSIDHLNQSAEFHIMVGDRANQNKGIGSFALDQMLYHAFENMNLQRIELTVLEDNARAQHVYEKKGFIREGIKRKAKYKNGRFVDMYLYAILKEDYKKRIEG